MTKMTLPMARMPAAIAESVAAVLNVHGLSLSPDLLSEIGNNTTQALFALDEPLMRYELGYTETYDLRRAYQVHGLEDVELLAAIIRLEQFEGTASDVTDLCHLAELAGLPWREMFPDVIPGSPALPPSSEASEERDGEASTPLTAPSRSGCAPSTADLLSVGQTLRALAAAGRPNADTAEVLARVGEWLADTAKAELAKGKAA